MFEKISSDKLVLGSKYMFVFKKQGAHSGIYTGPITVCGKDFVQFDHVYVIGEKKFCPYPFYLDRPYYYTFVSELPQWKMERRAVNLIVRRLLGDECFEW